MPLSLSSLIFPWQRSSRGKLMQHNHTIKYTTLRNRGETNLKQLKVEEMQQKKYMQTYE
jgi:hypothetical protein